MTLVVGGILLLRLHAFLALILAAFVVAALTSAGQLERFAGDRNLAENEVQKLVNQSVGERVAVAFGSTCGKIGILIALAAIIGKCLLVSGAADRVVRSALRLLGEPRAPVALLGSSFLLGIPVFFDTVFYLMIPLGKALGVRTGRNYCLYVLSIIAGATMAHSLVPPTPGPLFVASELKVELGTMILGGLVVGVLTAGAGYGYSLWANRR
jgi:GntP family gluconate:H+ symporter